MAHVLVTGGVRSGKSSHAETLLAAAPAITYVSPGYPADPAGDPEWAARVRAHQQRRPASWTTIESVQLAAALRAAPGPVLIDCLGTWLTRRLDAWDAWESASDSWQGQLSEETEELAAAITAHPHDVVIVTNEVGWGLVSEHRSGRIFADQLGRVNQKMRPPAIKSGWWWPDGC